MERGKILEILAQSSVSVPRSAVNTSLVDNRQSREVVRSGVEGSIRNLSNDHTVGELCNKGEKCDEKEKESSDDDVPVALASRDAKLRALLNIEKTQKRKVNAKAAKSVKRRRKIIADLESTRHAHVRNKKRKKKNVSSIKTSIWRMHMTVQKGIRAFIVI